MHAHIYIIYIIHIIYTYMNIYIYIYIYICTDLPSGNVGHRDVVGEEQVAHDQKIVVTAVCREEYDALFHEAIVTRRVLDNFAELVQPPFVHADTFRVADGSLEGMGRK